MTVDWLYDLPFTIIYPAILVLTVLSAELGARLGLAFRKCGTESAEANASTGAALGLLALLLGFSFSLALARFDVRRTLILEEANAIGSTANFALMLPQENQRTILNLLHEYVMTRIDLGVPFDPAKFDRDVKHSVAIQSTLWDNAVAVSELAATPLNVHRFVASLNEINNIHERRITALRNHVPSVVMIALVGVAMLALGFTGYHAGLSGARWHVVTLLMSVMVTVVIMLIIDIDRPTRGLINVSVQPLLDTEETMPKAKHP